MSFLLFILLSIAGPAWGCAGSCSSDADCAANPCRSCDTDYGICQDCCEFTEAIVCPATGCKWEYGECRNISGTSCGITLPETPKSHRAIFFIIVAGLALSVGGAWYRNRPKLKS